jgi:type IV secretion system protein VirD4
MNGMQARLGLAVATLLLAIVAGLYLSGYIALMWLKLNIPLEWNTWWRYWKALEFAQFQPFATKIKTCGAVGFGLPVLGWLLLWIPLFRRNEESLHGDARFANKADVAKAGLLKATPEGLLIGKAFGMNLYLGGAQHVIVTAATRTGKTAGIVVPILLTYAHSVVCSDLKGELYELTSAERKKKGHAVYRFAPYDEKRRTHRFNPFTALSDDPALRISQIQTIGAILYPDSPGKDPFWIAQARSSFLAVTVFLFDRWDERVRESQVEIDAAPQARQSLGLQRPDRNKHAWFPSFERIYKFASGDGNKPLKAMLQGLINESYISDTARTGFSSLAGLADDTFSSVIASMQEPLMQFANPILADATNASDFDVRQLRKRLMSVYMVIPPEKLGESAKLLNIFFSMVINSNLDQTPQEDPSNKYQLLMVLDEFATMGRVDALANRISIIGGYGVRSLVIVQSRAQLRAVYGPDDAQNLITNHSVSIVFTPREQADANEYSEMLGYRTIRKKHRSTSSGAGGGSVSIHYTEERRALMLAQELKELPKDDALLFYEGCRPIKAKKNWYFKDATFKAQIQPPIPVKPLRGT